ncbi:MAG: ribose 1,5-bisphosphate isomerase [Candidatus Methanofastidiosia archaeon]
MDPRVLKIGESIKNMEIRGAGKIARSAAEALKIISKTSKAKNPEEFISELKDSAKFLLKTRPTAVSLPNTLRFLLLKTFEDYKKEQNLETLKERMIRNSEEYIESSLKAVARIGEIGSQRIRDGDLIMTHCHSKCVVSVLRNALEDGKRIQVFVREARPRYQGRITARELRDIGIPVTLIVDSATRYFIGDINQVLIGADAITANGAVINKIGTSALGALAKEARVRVTCVAESYKFHPGTLLGELVEIEERSKYEIIPKELEKEFEGVVIRNPAFDITPPEYIDVVVTERGVIPPQAAIMVLIEQYGWRFSEKEPWD